MPSSPKAIIGTFSRLKPSSRWSFSKAQRPATTAYTHSYHRYPAKFIPQLVNKAVIEYTKEGGVVCDPFGGCGTTLVESKLLGRKSIGFDINPVAKLITDTKTRAISPKRLLAARTQFLEAYAVAGKRTGKTKAHKFSHGERIYYWFDRRMVGRLDRIYSAILSIKDKQSQRFFLCAFSHILKNCSRWLMKSIKPTIHPAKVFPNPREVFLRHLDSMIKKNDEFKTTKLVKREVSNKMITPWRDKTTGKFTGKANRHKKRAYVHEYVLVMEKI